MSSPGGAPPGWYPDPSGKPQNLYWDGAGWYSGIPAVPERMSSTKKLLWLALASFIAIKTPAWADIEGTRLGAYIAILGTTVLFISLISAAVTALIARKQRRSTPQAVQYGGYPPAGPPDLPR